MKTVKMMSVVAIMSSIMLLVFAGGTASGAWSDHGSYMKTTDEGVVVDSPSKAYLNLDRGTKSQDCWLGLKSNGAYNWLIATGRTGANSDLSFCSYAYNAWSTPLYLEYATGQIGLGTTNPTADLDIWDSDDSNTFASLALHGSGSNSNSFIDFYEGSGLLMYFCYRGDLNQLGIYSSSHDNPRVVFNRTGNVGIGASTPSERLTVKMGGSTWSDPHFALEDYDSTHKWDFTIGGSNKYFIGYDEATKITVETDGKVGIGTTNPISRLDVTANAGGHYAANIFNDGNNTNRYGLKVQCGSDNGTGKSYLVDFCDGNGSVVGNITFEGGTVSYNTFTAEHTAMIPEKDNGSGYPYGTVVRLSAAGTDPESPRQPIYRVEPSEKAYDTAVFGIYAGKSEREDNLHSIYAIGDGHILVTREGGEIRTGDYLATSNRRGCAMRQNDDLRHNYTVAKALESVDWEQEVNDIKLIACTYQTQ